MSTVGVSGDCLAFGDFTIDRTDERLLGPQGPVRLGNKAYRVLLLLAEQEGKLLTKDALFSSVWDGTVVSESALTSVIKELRRGLRDESRSPRYIESVYGRGYRLIPPVRAGAGSARPAPPAAAAASAPAASMPSRTGRPPLVLVSGFGDDAVRARYPYCAAELREEILSALARFREIQLIDDDRPEREAAAAHGAPAERDYQLTATLMPDGDGVKVIARARRLADGRVVWAETMALADIGTAGGVERIVRRIIGAALPAVDEDVSLGLPGESGDFYDRYLIAKRLSLTARGFDEAKAVAAALEDLVAERPDFGLAYPPLVRLYNTDFGYTGLGSTGPAERARALEMAKAGLAADPGNVHAYTVLGFCHLWHEEREPARDCFDRALALNPHNPVRLNEVASGMLYLGELEATRSLLDLSLLLQPFPDDSYYTDRCLLCLLEGEAAEAAAMVRKVGGQKLWARLYAALCAGAQDPAGSSAAFRSWVSSIEPCWVGGQKLSADELRRWIAFHHPLSGRSKDHFMDLVQRELSAMA